MYGAGRLGQNGETGRKCMRSRVETNQVESSRLDSYAKGILEAASLEVERRGCLVVRNQDL